jgi:two-component system, OmpR family, KDP operon response regulator KdpE
MSATRLNILVVDDEPAIEPDPEQPQFLLTETGVGYRLRAPE